MSAKICENIYHIYIIIPAVILLSLPFIYLLTLPRSNCIQLCSLQSLCMNTRAGQSIPSLSLSFPTSLPLSLFFSFLLFLSHAWRQQLAIKSSSYHYNFINARVAKAIVRRVLTLQRRAKWLTTEGNAESLDISCDTSTYGILMDLFLSVYFAEGIYSFYWIVIVRY